MALLSCEVRALSTHVASPPLKPAAFQHAAPGEQRPVQQVGPQQPGRGQRGGRVQHRGGFEVEEVRAAEEEPCVGSMGAQPTRFQRLGAHPRHLGKPGPRTPACIYPAWLSPKASRAPGCPPLGPTHPPPQPSPAPPPAQSPGGPPGAQVPVTLVLGSPRSCARAHAALP